MQVAETWGASILAASRLTVAPTLPAAFDEHGADPRPLIASKHFERMVHCVTIAQDKHAAEFASYLPHFLALFSNSALLAMDAQTVRRMRPKRRILLTKFLAQACMQKLYRSAEDMRPILAGESRPLCTATNNLVWVGLSCVSSSRVKLQKACVPA